MAERVLVDVREAVETALLDDVLRAAHQHGDPAGEWRLPRQTGDLHADRLACLVAGATATTSEQWAACALRAVQLWERDCALVGPMFHSITEALTEAWRTTVRPFAEQLPAASAVPVAEPDDDRWAAAIRARRERGTGPQAPPPGKRPARWRPGERRW